MATAFAYIASTSEGLTLVSPLVLADNKIARAEQARDQHLDATAHSFGFGMAECAVCIALDEAVEAAIDAWAVLYQDGAEAAAEAEILTDEPGQSYYESLYLDGFASGYAAGEY